jgi:hypothetical protein
MTISVKFRLDNFRIKETRSLHNDTDYIVFAVRVMKKTGPVAFGPVVKAMGDVNNGTHPVGLEFANVLVDRDDRVTLSYQFINAGHDGLPAGAVTSALERAGTKVMDADADNPDGAGGDSGDGGTTGSGGGSGWAEVVKAVASVLVSVLTANCDGLVAIDKVSFTGQQMREWLDQSSTHSATGFYRGNQIAPAAPFGCNASESKYYVTWSVAAMGFPPTD